MASQKTQGELERRLAELVRNAEPVIQQPPKVQEKYVKEEVKEPKREYKPKMGNTSKPKKRSNWWKVGIAAGILTAGLLYHSWKDKPKQEQRPKSVPTAVKHHYTGTIVVDDLPKKANRESVASNLKELNARVVNQRNGNESRVIEQRPIKILYDDLVKDGNKYSSGFPNKREDLDKSIETYRKTLESDPNNIFAHNNLGCVLNIKGDLDGAIKEYMKLLEIDPNNAVAHNNLGCVLDKKGDLDGAINSYRKALKIDANYVVAHRNIGDARYRKGELDGAIEEYKTALKIDPNYAGTYNSIGIVLDEKGDLDRAIEEFKKALKIDPNYISAHNNLGCALEKKGDLEGAVNEYTTALKLSPENEIIIKNIEKLSKKK